MAPCCTILLPGHDAIKLLPSTTINKRVSISDHRRPSLAISDLFASHVRSVSLCPMLKSQVMPPRQALPEERIAVLSQVKCLSIYCHHIHHPPTRTRASLPLLQPAHTSFLVGFVESLSGVVPLSVWFIFGKQASASGKAAYFCCPVFSPQTVAIRPDYFQHASQFFGVLLAP